MRSKHEITPPRDGDVFIGASTHRRVLAVANGYVLYSNGGDRNRECRDTTFKRWMRRQQAVKA